MRHEEIEAYLKQLPARLEALKNNPAESQAVFESAGICDHEGNLTERYKDMAEISPESEEEKISPGERLKEKKAENLAKAYAQFKEAEEAGTLIKIPLTPRSTKRQRAIRGKIGEGTENGGDMERKDMEYAIIKNSIRTLSVMCNASDTGIIDLLTGYLWDEEDAGKIKRSSGEFSKL